MMRRLAIIALAMAVTASLCPTTPLAAEPVKQASQPWVTNYVGRVAAEIVETNMAIAASIDFSTNNTTLVETVESAIPGNVFWVTTDGGRTLSAYPRVNGSTNTSSSVSFQRGNVWLEWHNGRLSAFMEGENE